MFTCPNEEFYSAFIDGEVSSQLEEKFEEHLSQCEKCRYNLERYKFLKTALVSDEVPILDLDRSFEKLLLKRNSIKRDSHRQFLIAMKYKAIIASSVAVVFLFVFFFVLLQHNSNHNEIYNLKKNQVKFIPILPVSAYKQHDNIITNVNLYDMDNVIKTGNMYNTKIYRDFANSFNSFSVLYTPLNGDVDNFNVIMPNVTGSIIYNYGLSVPVYTNLNK
jgi:hypothetical protein